ncbi:hypothetical protein ACF0H5_004789 [Mactra antiquata]
MACYKIIKMIDLYINIVTLKHSVTLNDICIHDVTLNDICIHDVTLNDICIHDVTLNDICIHDVTLNDICIHDVTLYQGWRNLKENFLAMLLIIM